VTTYTYDAANRLATQNGQTIFAWDGNGNMLADGSTVYSYDFENRLISTTLSGVNTQFGYNGDGIRLRLIEAGALTTYTQDYAAPLPVVLQAKTGTTSTQYVYSLGTRPLSEYEAAAWGEYLLADPLGSVRQIADVSGNVLLTQSYEPYGSVLTSQGSAASIFGYVGEQIDSMGLIYLRARYMQSRLGVFLSRDPWEGDALRPGSMNGWNYVGGNPVNKIDPSGKTTVNAAMSQLGLTNPQHGTTQFDIIMDSIPLEILEQLDRWFCKVPSDSLPQPEPISEWGVVYAEGAAGVIVANFGNQGIWIGREVVYNLYTKERAAFDTQGTVIARLSFFGFGVMAYAAFAEGPGIPQNPEVAYLPDNYRGLFFNDCVGAGPSLFSVSVLGWVACEFHTADASIIGQSWGIWEGPNVGVDIKGYAPSYAELNYTQVGPYVTYESARDMQYAIQTGDQSPIYPGENWTAAMNAVVPIFRTYASLLVYWADQITN